MKIPLYSTLKAKLESKGLDSAQSKDIIKTLDFKDFPFKTLYSTIG
ncbi:hypothetical protein T36_0492 [Helicobacter cinaedi]|nr:hypothetical protein [Helicobacter cinaedi]BDB64045.1 hypothetical protein T36_0492 [Helicobacter cinaedi]